MIAPDVGGGFGSKLDVYAEEALAARAREEARPAGEVDRGASRGLPRDDPRPRRRPGDRARGDRRGQGDGRARARVGEHGRVPPARHARDPDARRLAVRRRATTSRATTSSSAACSRTRRRPTRTAAPGRPEATYLDRARRWTRSRASSSIDPVELRRQNFMRGLPEDDRGGADDRLRRLRRARSTARSSCSDYEGFRREQAERRDARRARSCSASASRPTSRCAGSRRRASSARSATSRAAGTRRRSASCRPARCRRVIGTSPHGQGHVTTFSQIVADRLGVGLDDVEVLHGDTAVAPLGMDTYGSRSLAVGGVALCNATEKVVAQGAARSPRTSSRSPRRTWPTRAARSRSPGTDKLRDGEGGRVRGLARRTTCRTGSSRGSTRRPSTTRRTSAGRRAATSPSSRSTPETGLGRPRPLHRGRRRRQRDQPDDRQRPDPRRHRAGGRAGAVRGGGLRRGRARCVTGSMASYMVPAASELPSFELGHAATPSPTNPIGSKGVGETGTIASTPAVDQRRRRRARPSRRDRRRHAGDAGASLERT